MSLCDLCQRVALRDPTDIYSGGHERIKHQPNPAALKKSAQSCPFCHLFQHIFLNYPFDRSTERKKAEISFAVDLGDTTPSMELLMETPDPPSQGGIYELERVFLINVKGLY
jgi:hypothetical protein